MKKFCTLSIIFSISVCLMPLLILKVGRKTIAGAEIYRSIDKSKRLTKHKKLIIGDSTANQLFDNREDNDSTYYLACNQAIGVCGHFFLLNNYIEAGNRPQEVYMLYNALSFSNNLDQIYTFHYFLKPFYNEEYKPLMTSTIINQISKVPFYPLSQFPMFLISSWAPEYTPEEKDYTFLSPISREYLGKIDSLSRQYNFKLYIVPSLMDESRQEKIARFDTKEFQGEHYEDKLAIYLENIAYLNDSCFSDSTHLHKALVKTYRPLIEEKMQQIKKEYMNHYIYNK